MPPEQRPHFHDRTSNHREAVQRLIRVIGKEVFAKLFSVSLRNTERMAIGKHSVPPGLKVEIKDWLARHIERQILGSKPRPGALEEILAILDSPEIERQL